MTMTKTDQSLVPTKREVAAPASERVEREVTESQALRALQAGGIAPPADYFKNRHAVGAYLKQKGVLPNQRASAVRLQMTLEKLMDDLVEMVEKAKSGGVKGRVPKLLRIIHEAGSLADKISRTQDTIVEMEKLTMPSMQHIMVEELQPVTPSFVPKSKVEGGGTLVLGREIHMHAAPEKERLTGNGSEA